MVWRSAASGGAGGTGMSGGGMITGCGEETGWAYNADHPESMMTTDMIKVFIVVEASLVSHRLN